MNNIQPAIQHYRSLFNQSEHVMVRHAKRSMKQRLQSLADNLSTDDEPDLYGSGKLIESFEQDVAQLLGKEAALFLPSGTQAQPIALRIWADQARTPYVALPATSHVHIHEENAYQVLYQLKGCTLGDADQIPQLDDLKHAANDPLAAILLELPMREIGGQLPSWEALQEQSDWAREQGIKLHMDGARLWQCPSYYGKSLAEISALFDSVYVSFYKDLGGIAGAVLAGDADFISKAKIWQRRVGGNLYALYPYILAAKQGLEHYLPKMPVYLKHCHSFAPVLNATQGVSTWPKTPQTNMFRLRIEADPERFLAKASQWVEQNKIAILPPPYKVTNGQLWFELSFGEGYETLMPEQWREHWRDFSTFVLS
ncbi:beta-eliminating lyase-related protein [Reinekea marina]|uniref:Threonine aldolase family protein n=1 Tax=Reinekea marina TaxID=1310421 RepID=A0ABV7WUZ4_9GAMM|nr:beta-eliminating lyase-related protein [Reinekea marina]MDN3647404.1 beta-eliminating lyase-related protein [Reinekea marina]